MFFLAINALIIRYYRYHGIHQFNQPNLIVKDPELLKNILIKDFDHFSDRRFSTSVEMDPLFAKNLLHLKGKCFISITSINCIIIPPK